MDKLPYQRPGRVCSARAFAAASRRKHSYSLGACMVDVPSARGHAPVAPSSILVGIASFLLFTAILAGADVGVHCVAVPILFTRPYPGTDSWVLALLFFCSLPDVLTVVLVFLCTPPKTSRRLRALRPAVVAAALITLFVVSLFIVAMGEFQKQA